jgi:hypothetical protein
MERDSLPRGRDIFRKRGCQGGKETAILDVERVHYEEELLYLRLMT